ncbi:MAG TPA: Ig-like domain-containing protein [Terriglobales bacterium]|nr:Ig-like domain-containing protein [Terriglobales bacterium]
MKRIVPLFLCLLLISGLAGCGGGRTQEQPTPQVSVTVSPATATLIAQQSHQFTATVSNATNTAVSWSVSGTGCTGAACGTIDSTGLYKAPDLVPSNLTVTVTATSTADATKSGRASVNHLAVSITLSPTTSLTMISTETKQFTATVLNAPAGNAGVNWQAVGEGTIDDTGLYTAPDLVTADTTVTINVTSKFDNSKLASATISLKAPVITIVPGDLALELGGAHMQYTATVTNVPQNHNGVFWILSGPGTLTQGGLYTTPELVSDATTATIEARSAFDPNKTASAVVTLYPVSIAVSPKQATLYPKQTKQFTATVAHHVNTNVTWTATGASCVGAACGTIDANGLYTAPGAISEELQVTVTATSVADPNRSDTAIVTLEPIEVTVSPSTATVKIGATQQFTVTVQGGDNSKVDWTLSGTGCSGATCGTIDSTGLYTSPAELPSPPTVTVTATSQADPSRSDTAVITLVLDPNIKLKGQYAFVFTGWDPNGKAFGAIGSFISDGDGHITGLVDMNGASTSLRHINQSITGTYQVNAGDNRGQMTVNISTSALTVRFALDSTGSRGHILLFENTGMYGSGIFKRQTTADFSLANLTGDYVLGMTGQSYMGDERNALLGRFHTNGAGAISDTSLDFANTGESSMNFTFQGSLVFNAQTGMAYGRGTMPVTSMAGNASFSFYLVDSTEAYMIRTDPVSEEANILVGGMLKQVGGPYSAAYLNGKSVFYMSGLLNQTVDKAMVTIGQFNLTNGAGTSYYTRNWGGGLFTGSSAIQFDVASNGRATWTWTALGSPYILYLVGPNCGFILQYSDPGSSVNFGFFEPQSAGPFDNASLNGEFFGGAIAPATNAVDYGEGLQIYKGDGTWTGTGDVAGPSGFYPDQSVAGTYIITDSNIGSGAWVGTYPGTYHKTFYIINPHRLVFVPMEASNIQPAAEIFEK